MRAGIARPTGDEPRAHRPGVNRHLPARHRAEPQRLRPHEPDAVLLGDPHLCETRFPSGRREAEVAEVTLA